MIVVFHLEVPGHYAVGLEVHDDTVFSSGGEGVVGIPVAFLLAVVVNGNSAVDLGGISCR